MKIVKWLAPLALVLGISSADAQTWTKLNIGINRFASPTQIGVDIGTTSTNFIPIGTVTAGVFSFGDIYWTQTGTGAVQRTVVSRHKDEVFVTDFGVDKAGVASASAAINTDVGGAGACTVLKISATLATDTSAQFGVLRHVFTNNNYTSGNTDIYVHDLSIDNTSGPTTGAHIHALGFYKVTRAGVYNITITSASGKLMDDGTAFVASSEYFVRFGSSTSPV